MNKVTTTIERTTLVAVAICAAIPSLADTYAYKVQYLQSSGVQHIDTGVVPDRNTMFKGAYEYLGTARAKANNDMIAACAQPRYYPVSLYNTSDTHARHERYVSNSDTPHQTHPYLTRHTIVFNDALHRVFVDNKYINTLTSAFTGASHTCYLFASNNNNNNAAFHSKARIYWCEFTDAAATFDEVRIWKGALTAADLEASAATPCDTVVKSFSSSSRTENSWVQSPLPTAYTSTGVASFSL